jgi:hypothetical protein
MNEKSTNELDKILSGTKPDEFQQYISSNADSMSGNLSGFLNSYIGIHHLVLHDVIANCSISKDYAYQIFNGKKLNPSRDKVIAICIACSMNISDTNRTLKIAGHSPLYSKVERDAAIIIMINNGVFSIAKVNDYLDAHGLEMLNV